MSEPGANERRQPGSGVRVGKLLGIPFYVTPTWLVVAVLIMFLYQPQAENAIDGRIGAWSYLVAFVYAVMLYTSVVLHELGHSLVARGFGLPVRRITLHLLGGFSEIEQEPPTPAKEFAVAIAGPLVSLAIGGIAYVAQQGLEPGTVEWVLVGALWWVNLLVSAFNLLPGLPLDGGRVLRSIVWAVTRRPLTATLVAARTGQALAVAVVAIGMIGGWVALRNGSSDGFVLVIWGGFLGAFIWAGARQSLLTARLRGRVATLTVRRLTRRAIPVARDLPLSEAIRRARDVSAGAMVVVGSDGLPQALVSEATVNATPEHRRPWTRVEEVARDLDPRLRISADLDGEAMIKAMHAFPATEYLVLEQSGEVYGVLASRDVEQELARA